MCDDKYKNVSEDDNRRDELRRLISEAQSGKQRAFGELLKRYDPLIVSMVQRSRLDGMTEQDVEDLKQEAAIVFCNALRSYDAEQDGVEFGLYAKICIGNALKSALRVYNRRMNGNRLTYTGDDFERIVSEIPSDEDISAGIIEKEEYYALYSTIRNSLSPLENSIWWLYVSGISVGEIAEKISKSQKSVSNAVYRIRKKLRNIVGDRV